MNAIFRRVTKTASVSLLLALILAAPAASQLTPRFVAPHDHTGATQGGAIEVTELTDATLNGTTTNAGTISGGTISDATVSGTITNSGTISGGTVDGAALSDISSLSLTGSAASTKACASGYVRVSPSYCERGDQDQNHTLLATGVCTPLTLPSADAKALKVHVRLNAAAANAVSFRFVQVYGYASATCVSTAQRDGLRTGVREFSALTGGTVLSALQGSFIVSSTVPAILATGDAGGNSTGAYFVIGYLD